MTKSKFLEKRRFSRRELLGLILVLVATYAYFTSDFSMFSAYAVHLTQKPPVEYVYFEDMHGRVIRRVPYQEICIGTEVKNSAIDQEVMWIASFITAWLTKYAEESGKKDPALAKNAKRYENLAACLDHNLKKEAAKAAFLSRK